MHVHYWLHDIRLAFPSIGRVRAFHATAVVTLAIGMAGATVMFTLVRGILLFEIEPLDAVSLLGAAVGLIGAALVATWLPARRATRVDPIDVLRAE